MTTIINYFIKQIYGSEFLIHHNSLPTRKILMLTVQSKSSQQTILDLIKDLDLEPIKYKLVNPEEGEGLTIERVNELEQEYKLFLYLNYLYPNQSIVPTKEIDLMWHTHILDTQLYFEHSNIIFGKYLHHFPYFGIRGEEDAKNLENAFQLTLGLFEKHGTELGLEISAYCGQSCGSSLCDNQTCDSNACSKVDGLTTLDLLYSVRPRL